MVPEARKRIIVAIVIILTALIIVAVVTRIKRRKRRDRYRVGNPAAPRQELAARDLAAHLGSLETLGTSFADNVKTMDAGEKALTPMIDGYAMVVRGITVSMSNMRSQLVKAPPSYANLLGFYRGISGSDQHYLRTATAIEDAGHSIHQAIDVAKEGQSIPEGAYEKMGAAGSTLIEFAREIRGLLISTHRLGAALDVE